MFKSNSQTYNSRKNCQKDRCNYNYYSIYFIIIISSKRNNNKKNECHKSG